MTDDERKTLTGRIDDSWLDYTYAETTYTGCCCDILSDMMNMAGRDKIVLNDDICLWVRRRKKKSSYIYEVKRPKEPICSIEDISPDELLHIVCSSRDIIYLNSNDAGE